MKIQKTVLLETIRLAIGLAAADVILCIVFLLLGKFNYTVILGALFGSIMATLNFFLLGVTMQKALEKGGDRKKSVQASYSLRMLMLAVSMILGIVLPCFNTVAVIIPYLLPQPIILIMQVIEKKRA